MIYRWRRGKVREPDGAAGVLGEFQPDRDAPEEAAQREGNADDHPDLLGGGHVVVPRPGYVAGVGGAAAAVERWDGSGGGGAQQQGAQQAYRAGGRHNELFNVDHGPTRNAAPRPIAGADGDAACSRAKIP